MKVNWKVVSQSEGYKSLKSCLCKSLQDRHGTREELYHLFNKIIGRAQHYAYHNKLPLEVVLLEWESKRTYSWRSYYNDCNNNIPKLVAKSDHVARRSAKSWNKIQYRINPIDRKAANLRNIMSKQAGALWLKSEAQAKRIKELEATVAEQTTALASYNAAVEFACEDIDGYGLQFLHARNTGDFPEIRDEWPEAPEEVYWADPLHEG